MATHKKRGAWGGTSLFVSGGRKRRQKVHTFVRGGEGTSTFRTPQHSSILNGDDGDVRYKAVGIHGGNGAYSSCHYSSDPEKADHNTFYK